LQYREEEGAASMKFQGQRFRAKRCGLEKRGAYFSMWLADEK